MSQSKLKSKKTQYRSKSLREGNTNTPKIAYPISPTTVEMLKLLLENDVENKKKFEDILCITSYKLLEKTKDERYSLFVWNIRTIINAGDKDINQYLKELYNKTQKEIYDSFYQCKEFMDLFLYLTDNEKTVYFTGFDESVKEAEIISILNKAFKHYRITDNKNILDSVIDQEHQEQNKDGFVNRCQPTKTVIFPFDYVNILNIDTENGTLNNLQLIADKYKKKLDNIVYFDFDSNNNSGLSESVNIVKVNNNVGFRISNLQSLGILKKYNSTQKYQNKTNKPRTRTKKRVAFKNNSNSSVRSRK
jgi:hypothetical protein